MSGRKYYCTCDSNCKYETMTKEQILAAIAQAVETGIVGDCDTGFVTKLKETNSGGYVTLWVGTREQYEKIEEKAPNCIYIISNDTLTDDIWNTFDSMQKSVDEAMEHSATRAPWGLVTKTELITSWDMLNETVKSVVKSMPAHTVTIISCRCAFDFTNGARITISKSVDVANCDTAKVLFEDSFGTTMQCCAFADLVDKDALYLTEWEYINPPMMQGVEYRTAERHNGKPVYAKTNSIEMGDRDETRSWLIASDATDNFEIVSMDTIIKPSSNNYPWSTLPAFNQHDGSIAATCDISVEATGSGTYQVFADVRSFVTMLHNVATVTVKYTK